MSIQVQFLNPKDTSTWAGVIIHNSTSPDNAGDYIFILSPTGKWELQTVVNAKSTSIVSQSSNQNTITIDPQQAITIAASLFVINGTTYLTINVNGDNQIPVENLPLDQFSSPVQGGLIVEQIHKAIPSSEVAFLNFSLMAWR